VNFLIFDIFLIPLHILSIFVAIQAQSVVIRPHICNKNEIENAGSRRYRAECPAVRGVGEKTDPVFSRRKTNKGQFPVLPQLQCPDLIVKPWPRTPKETDANAVVSKYGLPSQSSIEESVLLPFSTVSIACFKSARSLSLNRITG
jgi:hypothetical protein